MKFTFKLYLLILATGLVWMACRKLDRVIEDPQIVKDNVSRFFSENGTTDFKVKNILAFVKRQNEKYNFVEKVVKQLGYPKWNKTVLINSGGFQETEDSTLIFLIPFVADSQTVVNSCLKITTTPSDTNYSYICNWQYNDSTTTGLSGRQQSLLLMMLDKNVFGERTYQITDSNAFLRPPPAKSAKYVKINSVANTGRAATRGGGNGLSDLTIITLYVCHTVWEPGGQVVGCNDMNNPECNPLVPHEVCEYLTFWGVDEDGGGSGGGSGGGTGTGSGGSGSGGTSGGGWTPPPPPPNGGPGWTPTPPECDSYLMNVLSNDTAFVNRFKFLQLPSTTGDNKEKGYKVMNRAAGTYSYKEGPSFGGFINWFFPGGEKIDGLMHSHYNGLNNIFSADDILLMAQLYIGGFVGDTTNFFFAMTSNTGVPYLLKVTNTTKFRNFANKIIAMQASKKNKFTDEYNDKLNSGDNTKNEIEFLKMLSELGASTGLTLFEAMDDAGTYNFNRWKKLNYNGTDVSGSECPQNNPN